MTAQKTITTDWNPQLRLLTTKIGGEIELEDAEIWEASLHHALSKIEDNGTFSILVNFYRFDPVNVEVQKRFRAIVPLILAEYGWKVGYINLISKSALTPIRNTRGIRCIAAAHVRQQSSRVENYEARYEKATERFFTNPEDAFRWISNIEPAIFN